MKAAKDVNALAFDPDKPVDPHAKHFIAREGARNKGLEITFDPSAHREWVTGFRKRKNERKTAAIKGLEQRAKRERQEERTERIKLKKQRLHLPDNYGVEDSDVEEDASALLKVTDQTIYKVGGVTTTVTTAAVEYGANDDAEDQHDDDDDDDADAEDPDAAFATGQRRSNVFPSTSDYDQVESDRPHKAKADEPPSAEAKTKFKGRKGGDGVPQHIKTANKLATLKARKSGGVRKLPGQGKSKSKMKAKAKAKAARKK